MSDVPKDDLKPGANELFQWAGELGVTRSRFAPRTQPAPDSSHPAMSVNLDACIQCTRCVRACREEQVNDVIGYASWGSNDRARKHRFLHFQWLPGAIATEFVSTDGRTFHQPPENWEIGSWEDRH